MLRGLRSRLEPWNCGSQIMNVLFSQFWWVGFRQTTSLIELSCILWCSLCMCVITDHEMCICLQKQRNDAIKIHINHVNITSEIYWQTIFDAAVYNYKQIQQWYSRGNQAGDSRLTRWRDHLDFFGPCLFMIFIPEPISKIRIYEHHVYIYIYIYILYIY